MFYNRTIWFQKHINQRKAAAPFWFNWPIICTNLSVIIIVKENGKCSKNVSSNLIRSSDLESKRGCYVCSTIAHSNSMLRGYSCKQAISPLVSRFRTLLKRGTIFPQEKRGEKPIFGYIFWLIWIYYIMYLQKDMKNNSIRHVYHLSVCIKLRV